MQEGHRLLAFEADLQMSRDHLIIEVLPARIMLYDLDSRNGTFVNGERVEQHELADGDALFVGETEFLARLRSRGAAE
jgi:pSer/pThr/pTyr-binding forkhead associated (FHA) protein